MCMSYLQPRSEVASSSSSAAHKLPLECGECSQAGTYCCFMHRPFGQFARSLSTGGDFSEFMERSPLIIRKKESFYSFSFTFL